MNPTTNKLVRWDAVSRVFAYRNVEYALILGHSYTVHMAIWSLVNGWVMYDHYSIEQSVVAIPP